MKQIAVHPVHRRLAEIFMEAERLGGFDRLSQTTQIELRHCLQANAKIILKIDWLRTLSLLASETNDVEWQHQLSAEIEKMEEQFL